MSKIEEHTEKKIRAAEEWLLENRIDEVEVMVPDHAGVPRGKSMPRKKFVEGLRNRGLRIPESIFGMSVNGEFVFEGGLDTTERDAILIPDLETLVKVPWQGEPTASVICDVVDSNGDMVPSAPRSVLRSILAKYEEKGWTPIIAPEFEFYLIARQEHVTATPIPPRGRSGKTEAGTESFSIDGVDEFGSLFDEIYDVAEEQNIQIDTLIHEAGPGQFEFNVMHGDPLEVADQSFYFKRCVRNVATRHGVFATFMARPYADAPGSAMHIHQSVVEIDTGRNIFADENGDDTELLRQYIAGLQKYLPAVMPMIAPYVNSYHRFSSRMSSPTNLHWGRENRTVGLRVPISGPEARRVENRIAGSDTNPYLAFAATLACGYLGIVEELEASKPTEGAAYEARTRLLPTHFLAGLDQMERCKALYDVFDETFVDTYVGIKKTEYEDYSRVLSPWETKFLMLNV